MLLSRGHLIAQTPTFLIALCGVLAIFGVIGPTLSLIAQAGLIGFCLGRAHVVFSMQKDERRRQIEMHERYIASLHSDLEADRVPDEHREGAEHMLAHATHSLDALERSAPPWTRWRERRARERASCDA